MQIWMVLSVLRLMNGSKMQINNTCQFTKHCSTSSEDVRFLKMHIKLWAAFIPASLFDEQQKHKPKCEDCWPQHVFHCVCPGLAQRVTPLSFTHTEYLLLQQQNVWNKNVFLLVCEVWVNCESPRLTFSCFSTPCSSLYGKAFVAVTKINHLTSKSELILSSIRTGWWRWKFEFSKTLNASKWTC